MPGSFSKSFSKSLTRSLTRSVSIAAGCVLAFALEGHVGVTSLKTLKLAELAERSGIIVLASPLKSFAARESLSFSDAKGGIPPLERRVYCFKRGDILKNADGAEIPDTLMVFEANTSASVQAHALAHSGGEVESPITFTYAGSLKEAKLGKETSVLLFLTLRREKGITPPEWFELSAANGYEKASKAKTVAQLLPKTSEPVPSGPK